MTQNKDIIKTNAIRINDVELAVEDSCPDLSLNKTTSFSGKDQAMTTDDNKEVFNKKLVKPYYIVDNASGHCADTLTACTSSCQVSPNKQLLMHDNRHYR